MVKAQKRSDGEMTAYTRINYCDLINNPQDYDGKQVVFNASYRYGFEWQEIFCLSCKGRGKIWLEFGNDPAPAVRQSFRKTPKHQGIVKAVFYGTFHGIKGNYGDGSYPYRFDLEFVKEVKVVYRDGRSPELLPAEVQKKVCQE